MTDRLLTTSEAAERLQVSDETMRRWADDKRIPHIVLPSGHLRFRPVDIDKVLEPVPVEPKE